MQLIFSGGLFNCFGRLRKRLLCLTVSVWCRKTRNAILFCNEFKTWATHWSFGRWNYQIFHDQSTSKKTSNMLFNWFQINSKVCDPVSQPNHKRKKAIGSPLLLHLHGNGSINCKFVEYPSIVSLPLIDIRCILGTEPQAPCWSFSISQWDNH